MARRGGVPASIAVLLIIVVLGAIGCSSSGGSASDSGPGLEADGPIVVLGAEGVGIGTPGGDVDYVIERGAPGMNSPVPEGAIDQISDVLGEPEVIRQGDESQSSDFFVYTWSPDDGIEGSTFTVSYSVDSDGDSQLERAQTEAYEDLLSDSSPLVASDRGVTIGSTHEAVLAEYDGEAFYDDHGRNIEFSFIDGLVNRITIS